MMSPNTLWSWHQKLLPFVERKQRHSKLVRRILVAEQVCAEVQLSGMMSSIPLTSNGNPTLQGSPGMCHIVKSLLAS